ncbi:asparagine synthase (glutamine-hydrolyzing) [Bacillus sp. 1P06AnD]|uniref:asparagine synthase (glutamine-hydrolyzing) n=1 Tax=Bacillus sp. 1P06AnD TaxID=3132208 RepID=UPI0039A1696E
MCGFVGYVSANENSERETIKQMADAIYHRGPDDEGYYYGSRAKLGFRRLSIIDLDHGKQPMYNEDETKVLVFNGEIYNYQELRKELADRGHIFTSEADSEVLIHGYEEYGVKLLNKLRGMFAFVIWDEKEKKLFGARDIFGIKPFYYYQNDDAFIFGSEVKGLIPNPAFKKEFNAPLLPAYLSYEYIPTDETLFKGVRKLKPGHYFEFCNGKFRTQSYYKMTYKIDYTKSDEEYIEEIGRVFKESVEKHMIADVEVGSFLSSGIDSSFVLNEAAKLAPVKSFSAGYSEEKYSELSYSTDFANEIQVENIPRKITAEEFFAAVPDIQYFMDEPLSNPSAIPLYFIANKASEYVKVVLSGEGADELFGGYNQYKEALVYEKYQKLPQGFRNGLASIARISPKLKGKRFLIRGAQPLKERYFRIDYIFGKSEREKLLKEPALNRDCVQLADPLFQRSAHLDQVSQMQYFDLHAWLANDILLKADRMSMANSIELRVPFLDRKLLELALQLPSELRVNKENTKYALRQAALKELPPKTANKKKLGFPSPLAEWMREEAYFTEIKDAFTGDIAAQFFNQEYIVKLLEDHKARRSENMQKIWTIYCFIIWYRRFFS